VQEQRLERDPVARGVLQYQIDELDRQIKALAQRTAAAFRAETAVRS
jgi:hypothetical protein